MPIPYRLGIDIGTNSLGWCALDLGHDGQPRAIRKIGVRIFSDGRDPQSGTSLAVDRRTARGARRRRDRYLDRRVDLMKALVRHGLMPADAEERKKLESLDPYELRADGLDKVLHPHHLGRAIFHLNQRRGFKSNRKTDKGQDEKASKETADMKGAIREIEKLLDAKQFHTIGEFLWKERRQGRSVRGWNGKEDKERTEPFGQVRARPTTAKGGRNEYSLYFARQMYEREFDAIWKAQVDFGQSLSVDAHDELWDIIFYQRPLKPVDPGPCTFEPSEKRSPLALPLVQDFRILQELANLEIADRYGQNARRLTRDERNEIYAELKRRDKFPFKGRMGIRKLLELPSDSQFNLEDERRSDLKGDSVSAALTKKECFGPGWLSLDERKQTEIVLYLYDEPEENAVIERARNEWGLSPEAAKKVANVKLPDGYGRLGLTALRKIVENLRDSIGKDGGLMRYDEAVAAADPRYHHSDFGDGKIRDSLPYYGEILQRYTAPVISLSASQEEREHGRIANPTVHVGLNQLTKLVNALIQKYGHPHEIIVELARDLKLNYEQREQLKKDQAANKKKNDERRKKLKELGQEGSSDGFLRLRLWEELNSNPADRKCIYTGRTMSCRQLFSDEVEIDHILPFKESLDDSPSNLIVCFREANRLKRKRTPHDAFEKNPPQETTWEDILLRITDLPKRKQWRFRPDALELVRDKALRALMRERGALPKEIIDDIERTGGFLARQLIDTAYLARVARQYLGAVCNPNNVRVVPGKLTALLRRKWGLNPLLYGNRPVPDEDEEGTTTHTKRRDDHRHHAIDAFVVACTSLATLTAVSTAAGEAIKREIDQMPPPWPGFDRHELGRRLEKMVVSHKPDRSRGGKLLKDTAFGLVRDPSTEGNAQLVYRKPLTDLKLSEIKRIRDKKLKKEVLDAVADSANGSAADLAKSLAAFSRKVGVRHVRLTLVKDDTVKLTDKTGTPYKAYSPQENHCVEVYELPDGKWGGEGINIFQANQPNYRAAWRHEKPHARLVMTVHKGDALMIEEGGISKIMIVHQLEPSANRFRLAAHNQGGSLEQRHDDREDPFRWLMPSYNRLKELCARKVTVDFLGRVRDPGPPK